MLPNPMALRPTVASPAWRRIFPKPVRLVLPQAGSPGFGQHPLHLVQPAASARSRVGPAQGQAMPIVVNLDVMLARRKMRSKELSERIGITEQNVSLLKSGKVKGIRFETLERICEVLRCQPGDILEYQPDVTDEPQSTRAA
jgi:putative transcriptional regulator